MEKFDFYQNHAILYNESDEQTRQASREHWQKIHAENVKSGRADMVMFSARLLADMAMIDAGKYADLF